MPQSFRVRALTSLVVLIGSTALAAPARKDSPPSAPKPELSAKVAPATDGASLEDPVSARAAWEAKESLRLAASPRGAAHLYRLHSMRDDLDSLDLLADTYARLLRSPSTNALTRDLARHLAADVARARGDIAGSKSLLAPLGFVHDFSIVGGFDNEGKGGCDIEYGPEKATASREDAYAGKAREVRWRPLDLQPLDGFVDLSTVMRPQNEVVGYAATFLEAPTATTTDVSLGTPGAFRLYVDGALVARSDAYHPPRPDQNRVRVALSKGVHRVVLKICQASGPIGFFFRQTPAPGAAAVKVVSPKAWPKLAKAAALKPATVLPTLSSSLEQLSKKSPTDTTLRGDYALVLANTRSDDETQHLAVNEARAAADAAPANAELQLLAAEIEREDVNVRRNYLNRALRAEPRHPRARLELAQLELSREHPERALTLVDALSREYPSYALADVVRARSHEALNEWPSAVGVVENAYVRYPNRPREVRDAARISRRLERTPEAIERLRRALSLRFDDGHSRRTLAALLTDTASLEEAEKAWLTHLTLEPYDNSARVRLAQLLVQNGREEEGFALYSAASALSPDEPELYEDMGRALLQTGKRNDALTAFERALTLRPQNPGLKETIRALKTDADSGDDGSTYAVDITPMLKSPDAKLAKDDAYYLIDNTFVRVQASGLNARFQQFAVKLQSDRGVEAFRHFSIGYAPSRQEVQILRTRIVKPDGSVVETYSESDRAVNDHATGMYYDDRVKGLSFPALAKGDVLEVWYRLEDTAKDNLLSDYWGEVDSIQSTYPKQRYLYQVEMPANRALYWNQKLLHRSLKTTQQDLSPTRRLYSFDMANVGKLVPEPQMPGWAEVAQTLHVSTYKTWEDVGRYYWGLIRDQLNPDEELKRTVERALKGVDKKDQLAVVRALYGFVVTNTRYVALEFGIHGYKPYRVDKVLARRFGDCKDKASLIHAMLKVAGVESRLVLLRTRPLGDIGAEPASLSAFNHAILYVPKFDLFLDGTAEFHGAKELPTSDRAANVLIIEPSGKSTFRVVPEAKAEDNTTALTMNVTLKKDGGATMAGQSVVTGVQAPDYRRAYQAEATRRSSFERGWGQSYPGLKVQSLELSDLTQLEKDVKLQFQLSAPRFSDVKMGTMRFFPFGTGSSYVRRQAPLAERRYDLRLDAPSRSLFTYRYTLPDGATLEDVPADVEETTPFGTVKMKHHRDGNTLVSEGEILFTATRVSAKDYPAYRGFLSRVDEAFSNKVTVKLVPGTRSASSDETPLGHR